MGRGKPSQAPKRLLSGLAELAARVETIGLAFAENKAAAATTTTGGQGKEADTRARSSRN